MSNSLEDILYGLKKGLPEQKIGNVSEMKYLPLTPGQLNTLGSKSIKGRSIPLEVIDLYTSKDTGIKVKFMPLDQYLLVAPKE